MCVFSSLQEIQESFSQSSHMHITTLDFFILNILPTHVWLVEKNCIIIIGKVLSLYWNWTQSKWNLVLLQNEPTWQKWEEVGREKSHHTLH